MTPHEEFPRRRTPVLVTTSAVLVFVLYLLSSAPVLRLMVGNSDGPHPYSFPGSAPRIWTKAYHPVIWVAGQTPASGIVDWWFALFGVRSTLNDELLEDFFSVQRNSTPFVR